MSKGADAEEEEEGDDGEVVKGGEESQSCLSARTKFIT